MTKTKISEFSPTPGNNTDIDGINIAEGCPPSSINNAIRELMAQLKDFQAGTAGDSFNGPIGTTTAAAGAFTTLSASGAVSGVGFSNYLASPPAIGGTAAAAGSFTTLTTSGAVTHNAGTANSVPYLNGSKVLTTGSALTFDGTTLAVNGNNISAVNSLGFRNRIINGDMRIDQRNNGASVTPAAGTPTYTLDRWVASQSQESRFSVQQNAGGVTPPSGFTNYLGVTSLSAYSVLASDSFNVRQIIEGFNVADFGWGTTSAQSVTLSFWVRSSLTGTFGGAFRNAAANRSHPFTYTISSANTWEFKTITVPGDTSGTWLRNNGVGVSVFFGLGVGGTFSGTAGSWAPSDLNSATGAVSVVGTSGATFYITGVQLEAGSVATPFERRDYGRELMMCQRYYWGETNVLIYSNPPAANLYFGEITSPVPMRVAPSVTLSAFDNGNSGNASINAAFPRRIRVQATSSVAGTAYSQFTLAASSEL